MREEKLSADIEDLIKKWKDKKGSLIMILHGIQDKYGYVPRATSLQLSRYLDIPLARIYEVITFYHYFRLEPPGKHHISVCMGTACYLKGASGILQELKNILSVEEGRATKDGRFFLDVVRCIGCCGLAPVIKIDQKVYSKVAKDRIVEILSEYEEKEVVR